MRVLVPWGDLVVPAGVEVSVWDGGEELPGGLGDVEFFVLPYDRGRRPVELIAELPAVRAVQTLNAGFEEILPVLPAGVCLANGRGLHDLSVAEHTLALILAAQRDLPRWARAQAAGVWDHAHTRSLADSRVLILGYGSIGRAIERYLLAGEAVVTRVARTARAGVHGIDELPKLLPEADILVAVLPGGAQTWGLLGAAELAALPDGALVVNVGRGTSVDTAALTAEVAAGRLRAALDVVAPEPLPSGHPLWSLPGVIITPHVAGGSDSFTPRARRLVERQLAHLVAGEELENLVVPGGHR
ncbi:2-hydroxyacid dehydrogenase [Nocardia stercoris]|nr:2-hydroxyacid dehydrogenase [Nocardia stercoris]